MPFGQKSKSIIALMKSYPDLIKFNAKMFFYHEAMYRFCPGPPEAETKGLRTSAVNRAMRIEQLETYSFKRVILRSSLPGSVSTACSAP
jgi:hypothetical protein